MRGDLSTSDVAARFGVSPITARLWCRRGLFPKPPDVSQAARIEALVRAQHLAVGYAGYWGAQGLDWTSHGRLRVYPVFDWLGPVKPMYLARAAAWYRPRPHTASYLLLSPDDPTLVDRLPPDLPRRMHEVRIGSVTMAIYPYDLASHFDR